MASSPQLPDVAELEIILQEERGGLRAAAPGRTSNFLVSSQSHCGFLVSLQLRCGILVSLQLRCGFLVSLQLRCGFLVSLQSHLWILRIFTDGGKTHYSRWCATARDLPHLAAVCSLLAL